MKKSLIVLLCISMAVCFVGCERNPVDDEVVYKPVIYLYPQQDTVVDVSLRLDGQMLSSYPKYDNGWHVLAKEDGTLMDLQKNRMYYALFWEGKLNTEYDFSTGFVVKGEESREFLETTLRKCGLSDREANEFIMFWLPKLEENRYNLISFQTECYTSCAELTVKPEPQSVLRVFMACKKIPGPIAIAPQEFTEFERNGFTVVEWGGCFVE